MTESTITTDELISDFDRLVEKLHERIERDGGRTFDVNQQTWSAQMHYILDVLERHGVDRAPLADRAWGA